MIAYCDRKTGCILFGDKNPSGTLLVATHRSLEVLCDAVKFSGARYHTEYKAGRQAGEPSFAVPWFSTAKFPEDEEECARRFAIKVAAWLEFHSSVH